MTIEETIQLLIDRAGRLAASFPLTWRYPARTPRRPLSARVRSGWKTLRQPDQERWKKNEPNWFYTELVFPSRRFGLPVAGHDVYCFVDGWMPFKLWIDGTQVWREDHTWKATGPIADPFPFPAEPTRQYRFVLAVTPTELPANTIAVAVRIVPRLAYEMSVDLRAAAAELQMAAALARNAAEMKQVRHAAACLEHDALTANRWKRVREGITEMEQRLDPFSARARSITVHALGHAHIDMDWKWTWDDTVHCIRRDFRAVTDLMEAYTDLCFTHSQVPTYDVVRKEDTPVFRKVRERIEEGRWENVAGTWVEGDLNMVDGESIVRHILYAKQWTQKTMGSEASILWEPDTFGHPGNLPQLARLGEFEGYFHMRCHPEKENAPRPQGTRPPIPAPVRLWSGVDGTTIPALSLVYNGDLSPDAVVNRAIRAQQIGLHNALHIWGLGDHGGALSRLQIETLERYRDRPLIPRVRFSTMKTLLAAIQAENIELPANKGETYSLFEGCFTTHASIKRYNRRCESALLSAETLAALANVDVRRNLRSAWQKVLFNHFHDIMDGASVHDAYVHAHARAESALSTAKRASNRATRKLLGLQTRTGRKKKPGFLTLFNTLGFSRSEPVFVNLPHNVDALETHDGHRIPVQRFDGQSVFLAHDLPAFGSRSYRLLTNDGACNPQDIRVWEDERYPFFNVETETAWVRLSRISGTVGSYYDRRLNRELVAYGFPIPLSHTDITHAETALNVFQLLDEAPNRMSAWLMNDILRETHLLRDATVERVATGPVFAHFRVQHRFRSSSIAEDILVYRNFPRLHFRVHVDWRERGNPHDGVPQLKIAFGTDMRAARCRTEGPFVVREIPANGQEMPTQKWSDLSGDRFGFTVLNDSKYGMDALGGRLRVTLLRNPYSPDPETDNGRHEVNLAFDPHAGTRTNADCVRSGLAFNRPPVAATSPCAPAALPIGFRLRGSRNVVCTALRQAEYSNALLLRLFESNGKRCRVRLDLGKPVREAREVNFLENPLGPPCTTIRGDTVPLSFRPFEVKTLAIRT